jgi:4-amino-4-deoxy-L-arabinose transferase-like glycosyltransferase
LSRLFASLGPLLLAINPTFIFLAQQPMSDGPSTFWGLLLIWAGLRSRESRWWMVLAGFAFGTAFLLRPTNVLFLVPLTFCIPIKPRAIALFALGGVPLAAVFLHYNYQVFGNPFSTGYESIGLLDRFDLTGVGRRFKS